MNIDLFSPTDGRSAAGPSDGAGARDARQPRRARPLVLVVEDEANIARLIQRFLARARYDALIARDGSEALRLAVAEQPDVITLDLVLPGISGLDVFAALRANPRTRDIPVIVVSIHGDEQPIEALPVFAILSKPLDQRSFIKAVSDALRQRDSDDT